MRTDLYCPKCKCRLYEGGTRGHRDGTVACKNYHNWVITVTHDLSKPDEDDGKLTIREG